MTDSGGRGISPDDHKKLAMTRTPKDLCDLLINKQAEPYSRRSHQDCIRLQLATVVSLPETKYGSRERTEGHNNPTSITENTSTIEIHGKPLMTRPRRLRESRQFSTRYSRDKPGVSMTRSSGCASASGRERRMRLPEGPNPLSPRSV